MKLNVNDLDEFTENDNVFNEIHKIKIKKMKYKK